MMDDDHYFNFGAKRMTKRVPRRPPPPTGAWSEVLRSVVGVGWGNGLET